MPHPSHPPTRSRCRFGALLAGRPAMRGTPRGVRQSDGEPPIPGIWQARHRGQRREPCAELATLACGYGRPRACGPARPDPAGGGDRTPSPAPADGAAVGGELAVGANVEGARCPMLMAVGTVLACVSNESRRVVTIRLH